MELPKVTKEIFETIDDEISDQDALPIEASPKQILFWRSTKTLNFLNHELEYFKTPR